MHNQEQITIKGIPGVNETQSITLPHYRFCGHYYYKIIDAETCLSVFNFDDKSKGSIESTFAGIAFAHNGSEECSKEIFDKAYLKTSERLHKLSIG